MRWYGFAASCLVLVALGAQTPKVQPGNQAGRVLTPTNILIEPYGSTLEFNGRPVDVAMSPDGSRLFVKDMGSLRVVDPKTLTEVQSVASKGGASSFGLAVGSGGAKVYFSNAASEVHEFSMGPDGKYAVSRTMAVPGPEGKGASYPTGMAVSADGRYLYACLSRANQLVKVELATGSVVARTEVGIAPYAVAMDGTSGLLIVTNQGGFRPRPGQKTAPSAGTETPVDERGVAKTGSVSFVSPESGKVVGETEVGLQPTAVVVANGLAYVANANGDSICVIDLASRKVVGTVVVKPSLALPFGSMPDGLAVTPDRRRLLVALAGNNAVAVLSLNNARKPVIEGFVPTGWYPAAVAVSGDRVFVANNKGVGSRSRVRPVEQGWNSHDHRGSVQRFGVPTPSVLRSASRKVLDNARVPQILAGMERRGSSRSKPVPIPARLGDPSTIEHVIYVIKENRTYDQVFGDMKEGDGDAKLCVFGEEITPNHHALAREFGLLDNYYCNGVLSADGHSWATEGNVTPYLERMFGGFTRSYTFGDDPLTYSSSGFLWDHVLAAGLSFRNYGEFNYAEPPAGMGFKQVWDKYAAKQPIEFAHNIGVERVRMYSNLRVPGWNMNIPDQIRVDRFLEEFREFERKGTFPNLVVVYLPQDHTSGTEAGMPTPRAHVADNDLAVGRLVEAVSKSRFWPKTAIFINEDDPQAGFDHVDGHRSLCLVVSPYSRRGAVVSEFYNQTSVLRTIERIFGMPPINQRTASSPIMTTCFTDKPNLKPYTAIPVKIPLDELNPPSNELTGDARYWAEVSARIPLRRTGLKTAQDDDNLNRIVWHAMKGYETPYPAEYAGYHGKGLKKRGLRIVEDESSDR
ncbi:MAG: bifunctional YncE family protein/alkaline phosphatase family protein [Fimbriimonadaceae bacterium]|nr:bifunctional YncE family protein/alkaline phosphatase family protein [Fimbriimonadaceae bacterium]